MLIDELDNLNLFLKEYAVYLALAGILIILIVVFLIYFSGRHKKVQENFEPLIMALGGKENIVSVEARGSRLALQIKDDAKVDYDHMPKDLVSSFIKMTGKLILIVGEKSKKIAEVLNKKAD